MSLWSFLFKYADGIFDLDKAIPHPVPHAVDAGTTVAPDRDEEIVYPEAPAYESGG